jgi:hypothetical protein
MSDISRIEARLAALANATLKGNIFNRANTLVKLELDGKLPALDGSALTGIVSGVASISYIATDNIAAYDPVTSNGKLANSNTIAQRGKIIGIANVATLIGFSGTVIGSGTITNPLWSWAIGDIIFLNGTSLSTTPPTTGYLQIIGTATAADTIDIKLPIAIRF